MDDLLPGSSRLGLDCRIFISQYVSETRVKEIENLELLLQELKVIMRVP